MVDGTSMFVCFCPLGEACGWGGRRLGKYQTEEAARSRIEWHLTSSSKHEIDEGQAKELAGEADLLREEGWEQDSNEWEAKPSTAEAKHNNTTKGKSMGKGWQRDKSTGKGWQREAPYTVPYAVREMVVASPSSSSMSQGHSALTAMVRCEAAARTAARMSRSAASGFDAEGDVLANEIAKLKACMQ